MVDPLSYFSFQPVFHNWCNKGRGMCYPVYGMVHIKELLLLIGKRSPCGGSGFPLSLSEWSFTICLTPYNRKYNVLNASLNNTIPSFLISGRGVTHWCSVIVQWVVSLSYFSFQPRLLQQRPVVCAILSVWYI